MNQIVAVSFDADDTLLDFKKVMKHALTKSLEEIRRLFPTEANQLDVAQLVQIRNEVAEQLKGKISNLEMIRLEAFKETLIYIGHPNDEVACHLNDIYMKHRFEDIELFDDVLPTLDALQQKYKLGLFSNGNSYPELCGLGGRFHFTVFAHDYGVEKPDQRLFDILLEKAQCDRTQIVHVGDSLTNDICGANLSGIRSVWINRDAKKNDTEIQPAYVIQSLVELIDLLN